MAWTEKYVTTTGTEAWATNSAVAPSSLSEAITNVAAGQRVNIKAGTYANTTTTLTLANAGSTTAPIWWRGYKTTIGDQDAVATATKATDVPLITFSTGQLVVTGAYQTFSNIVIESACTTTGGAVYFQAANAHMYRCRVTNSASNSDARGVSFSSGGTTGKIVASYIQTTASAIVINLGAAACKVVGCVISGGLDGINSPELGALIAYCIFDNQADDCIAIANRGDIINCSFYSPAGHGINMTTAAGATIANNYFEDVNQAGKAAIANTSGANTNLALCVNNAFYNCTANYSGITESFAIYDQGTIASAAFTDPANDDFRVGTVAKAIGFPGAMENLANSVGYVDVGALQRIEPAASGGIWMPRARTVGV